MPDFASIAVYIPFLLVMAGFVLLFICSKGLFGKASVFLLDHFPSVRSSMDENTLKTVLMILFTANILAMLFAWNRIESDTAAKGFLLREEYGGSSQNARLIAESEGEKHLIDLEIPARTLSAEEKERYFREAEENLPKLLFGSTPEQNGKMYVIREDLALPQSIPENPVRLYWTTDRPEILDWDGHICSGKAEVRPSDADNVLLTAEMSIDEELRECDFSLKVYPRLLSAEEAAEKELKDEIENNNVSEEKIYLPAEAGGRQIRWSSAGGGSGIPVLFLGGLAAVLYVYSGIRKKQDEKEAKEEGMELDYPGIVSKLVLLLTAGMSLRSAFRRICSDYLVSLKKGGRIKPGYEELLITTREMERGIPEAEAYDRLGRRSSLASYRTFSTLLVQNLTKGGNEMYRMLEIEAQEAFENRKKQAAVLGEKAGTKLLFPMLLMLGVVMGILVVPAFFAFF